ncbi:MAG TPA: cytochrome C oxidase subunit IV family protein [Gemmatimonadaceae bacterium]|nr:cytochrome C oxidase subunit IV family protein [Gemmatimonadaceae bacterium]
MPTAKLYVGIWLGLIAIVAIETVLAFSHLSVGVMVAALLVLAIVEAGMALRYFMHLKYEPPALFWTLIPAIVFALLMMNQVWPDAHRLVSLHFP